MNRIIEHARLRSAARWLAVALPAALVTLACNDATQSLPVATVTVTPGQDSLSALGATRQFTAAARDANGGSVPGQTFVWTSSAPAVASVDTNGLVTALANGPATITATTDGIAGTALVTVAQAVATVFVGPDSVVLRGIGTTSLPLNAVAYDGNDSTIVGVAFTWSAADTSVATISGTTRVATARGLGTTTIAATSGGVTGTADVTVDAHFYVSAATGDDANKGTTAAAPFKRITQALSVAAAGNTIKVLPGLYDQANGESFPIQGPTGVILLGDELNKGGGPTPTEVLADGSSVFRPPANAVIAGFTITNNNPSLGATTGVSVAVDGVTLRSNRISSLSYVAVNAGSPNTGVITGNVITGNLGIQFCGGPGLRIEHNTITNNQVGVFSNCGTGDFGGGSAGSAGGNVIACNTAYDVHVSTGATIMAAGNRWDHVPPTLSTTSGTGGVDFYATNGSSLVTTGAALAPSPCP